MFILKKLISALLLPPGGAWLLFLCGWLCYRGASRWRRRLGALTMTLGALAALLLPLNVVGNALLESLEIYGPVAPDALKSAQAIVVLAGGANRNALEYAGGETVSRYSLERIRYAASLARQTGLPLLLTGGSPFGGAAEATLMRDVLEQEFAVPVRWVESESNDTGENATLSAPVLKQAGVQRIALVSHAFHLRRAVPLFEAQGLTVIPAPTVFHQADWGAFDAWLPGSGDNSRIAAHEWLGHFVNRLRSGFR